ncbi:MAG: hypothetical protein QXO32_06485 [Candidatus Bathyarchaeia archaeon]
MRKKIGFVRMTEVKGQVERVLDVGIGALGYAFMGKAHSQAYIDLEFNVDNCVIENFFCRLG